MSKKPLNAAETQLTPERIKFLTEAATKLCAAFIGIRNFDAKDAESRKVMSQRVRLAETPKRRSERGLSFQVENVKSQHQTARTILSNLSDEDREILRGSKMIMDLANACGFANAKTNFLFSASPIKPYKVKTVSGRIIDDSLRLAITNIAKNPIETISVDRSESPLSTQPSESELSASPKDEPFSREPIPVFKLKKSKSFSGIPLALRSPVETQRPKTTPAQYSSLTITIPPTPDYIYSPDYFTSPLAAAEKTKDAVLPITVNNDSEAEVSPLAESQTASSLSSPNSVKSFDSDSTAISIATTPISQSKSVTTLPNESEREVIKLRQLDKLELITRTSGDSDSFHYARNGLDQLLRSHLEELDKKTPNSARESLRFKNSSGETILHLAASSGSLETINLLLSDKYKPKKSAGQPEFINLVNEEGKSALHIAVEKGYIELAQLLIENGARLLSTMAEFKPQTAEMAQLISDQNTILRSPETLTPSPILKPEKPSHNFSGSPSTPTISV